MKRQSFIFDIKNNTPGNIPLTILNTGYPANNSAVNAHMRYAWNVTGETFSPPFYSIQVKFNTADAFTTLSGVVDSFAALLTALNNLNIGRFAFETSGPNTYVVAYNDQIIYGDMVIGTALTPNWITTGGLQVNALTPTNASISVSNVTQPNLLSGSGGVIIPPQFIPYVWNLPKTSLELAQGDLLAVTIDASPGGPYNMSIIVEEDAVVVLNTGVLAGFSISGLFTWNYNSTYNFICLIDP